MNCPAWYWCPPCNKSLTLTTDRSTAGLLFSCVLQTLTGKASYISKTASLTSVSSTSTLEQNTAHWEPSCPSSRDDWPSPGPSPWELTASYHFTNDEDVVFQRSTLSKGPLMKDGGYSRRNWMGSKPWILLSSDISQRTGFITTTAQVKQASSAPEKVAPYCPWAFIEELTNLIEGDPPPSFQQLRSWFPNPLAEVPVWDDKLLLSSSSHQLRTKETRTLLLLWLGLYFNTKR